MDNSFCVYKVQVAVLIMFSKNEFLVIFLYGYDAHATSPPSVKGVRFSLVGFSLSVPALTV